MLPVAHSSEIIITFQHTDTDIAVDTELLNLQSFTYTFFHFLITAELVTSLLLLQCEFRNNKEVEMSFHKWFKIQDPNLYHDGIFKFMPR
jgi:hypothetical protein